MSWPLRARACCSISSCCLRIFSSCLRIISSCCRCFSSCLLWCSLFCLSLWSCSCRILLFSCISRSCCSLRSASRLFCLSPTGTLAPSSKPGFCPGDCVLFAPVLISLGVGVAAEFCTWFVLETNGSLPPPNAARSALTVSGFPTNNRTCNVQATKSCLPRDMLKQAHAQKISVMQLFANEACVICKRNWNFFLSICIQLFSRSS